MNQEQSTSINRIIGLLQEISDQVPGHPSGPFYILKTKSIFGDVQVNFLPDKYGHYVITRLPVQVPRDAVHTREIINQINLEWSRGAFYVGEDGIIYYQEHFFISRESWTGKLFLFSLRNVYDVLGKYDVRILLAACSDHGSDSRSKADGDDSEEADGADHPEENAAAEAGDTDDNGGESDSSSTIMEDMRRDYISHLLEQLEQLHDSGYGSCDTEESDPDTDSD